MRSLPGTVILVVDFSLSLLYIRPAIPFWPAVSAERPAVKHMGFPLYVTCCFSLAAFFVFFLAIYFFILAISGSLLTNGTY